MEQNISAPLRLEEQISHLLSIIGQPARIQILLVIAAQEACVCHLEVVTGMRQASISQHLMTLRKAGLVTAHRAGRNIFYRLARPGVIELIEQAAHLLEVDLDPLQRSAMAAQPGCTCPNCSPGLAPEQTCHAIRRAQP